MNILLFGVTGLVGNGVLEALLTDSTTTNNLRAFARRPVPKHLQAQKQLEWNEVNFQKIDQWPEQLLKGDVLFLSLGTTRAQAGSWQAQYQVDVEYTYEVAKLARKAGIKKCLLVSSQGASLNSWIPYFKMKGEIEQKILSLQFDEVHLLRPTLLLGERGHSRPMEDLAKYVVSQLVKINPWPRFNPHPIKELSKEIASLIESPLEKGIFIHEADKLR